MKAPCDVKGCSFVAEHPTKYVNAMLGNHKRHAHGIMGKTAKYRQPKTESAPAGVGDDPPKERKRKSPIGGLNFCPCCGTNLRAVQMAMSL